MDADKELVKKFPYNDMAKFDGCDKRKKQRKE